MFDFIHCKTGTTTYARNHLENEVESEIGSYNFANNVFLLMLGERRAKLRYRLNTKDVIKRLMFVYVQVSIHRLNMCEKARK